MSTSSPAISWWPEARKHVGESAGRGSAASESAARVSAACESAARASAAGRFASAEAPHPAVAAPASAAVHAATAANRLGRRLRLAFALPQLDPADLACEGLRQVGHELDLSWI